MKCGRSCGSFDTVRNLTWESVIYAGLLVLVCAQQYGLPNCRTYKYVVKLNWKCAEKTTTSSLVKPNMLKKYECYLSVGALSANRSLSRIQRFSFVKDDYLLYVLLSGFYVIIRVFTSHKTHCHSFRKISGPVCSGSKVPSSGILITTKVKVTL